jgi:hypothetical protein
VPLGGRHLGMRPDNIEGHPFHAASNVNGIGIASMIDYQVLPLDPRIREIQEAYIKRVVDTVQDLPNVLYEVANEASGKAADRVEFPDGSSLEGPIGDTTEWQYWVIELVKRYERERDYMRHPIGMTMLYPVPDQSRVNDVLLNSPADWISPGFDDQIFPHGRWYTDPPASDGSKVVITDTDHYAPGSGDALWAWKSFVRGQHPIPHGLRDHRRRQPARPVDRRPADRGVRAGPARHGRHAPLRGADAPSRDGAAGGPRVDHVRAGEPGARVPGAAAGGERIHGGAGARHVPGGVVRGGRPRDRR